MRSCVGFDGFISNKESSTNRPVVGVNETANYIPRLISGARGDQEMRSRQLLVHVQNSSK